MKENDTFKVTIESYDANGYGVCHIESKVTFVKWALEGEDVICKITNVHKKYAFAECIKVLKKSEHRTLMPEELNDLSGEADLIHVDYETEKKIKENKVKMTLRREGYIQNPIIAADKTSGYRNKVMVPFGSDEAGEVVCGFYQAKTHKIIDSSNDFMSSDIANTIIYLVKRYMVLFHVKMYNEKKNKGIFREVMIRHTSLNEYMVVLVATQDYDFTRLVEILTDEIKEIKSIYLNINPKQTNVVLSDEYKLLYGKDTVTEDILGLKFDVYPASFMQVNHDQCEKLYTEALRMAELKQDMNVIDAYCGIGSITLNIAKRVNKVYGIEIVPDAIKNANNNKVINNIANAEFICGPCEEEITKLVNKEKIDVIFFDPPRKGCDVKFLNTVIDMKIPKIVYVSCGIATAARDIGILEEAGYELKEVTPVDLFPKTSHVETVVKLELSK